jgi:hypothetical protein
LELRFQSVAEIEVARLDLWAAQLLLDEASGDDARVGADAFAMDYVRDRILRALDPADLTRVNVELGAIQKDHRGTRETPGPSAGASDSSSETPS